MDTYHNKSRDELAAEIRIVQSVIEKLHIDDATMTPPMYPWDAELLIYGDEGTRETVGILETKTRTCSRTHFETYQISQSKIENLLWASLTREIPAYLAVEFLDGIFMVTIARDWLDKHARSVTMQRRGEGVERAIEWSNRHWSPVPVSPHMVSWSALIDGPGYGSLTRGFLTTIDTALPSLWIPF